MSRMDVDQSPNVTQPNPPHALFTPHFTTFSDSLSSPVQSMKRTRSSCSLSSSPTNTPSEYEFNNPWPNPLSPAVAYTSGSATPTRSASPVRKRSRPQAMTEVAPSYVKKSQDAQIFNPGDYLGIFAFLPGSTVSFRVSMYSLLRQSSGPKIFAFYGQGHDHHIRALSELSGFFRREYDASIYAVCVTPPDLRNLYGIPIIFDPKTSLTRYCRALHPVAGGRHAMNVIIIVDDFGKKRCFLPVGYGGYIARPVAIEDLDWVVTDALRYLRYEQHHVQPGARDDDEELSDDEEN
ncbi:uncharacterized protein V1513DRAFT_23528 [Lipomyces chichibuensis]|uniref:uncharacterized protein n=1 Tax=Lipomyces chichibuensis TaxID=1546026 RepID=UPI003343ADA6